jgi:hypothetical protein
VCAQDTGSRTTLNSSRKLSDALRITLNSSASLLTGSRTPLNGGARRLNIGARRFEGRREEVTRSQIPHAIYQSAYFVPSSAVASEPLLTSYTPGGALGLFGSGSLATVCQVDPLNVNGSSGTFRR